MQDPLKQGLKPFGIDIDTKDPVNIRMQDPLKQGLKREKLGNTIQYLAEFECKIH